MSDQSRGAGWWLASDGKWYPPTFEYQVIEVRQDLVWGKMRGGEVERVMNEQGRLGWELVAMERVEVKGRVGPAGVGGMMLTFKRQTA